MMGMEQQNKTHIVKLEKNLQKNLESLKTQQNKTHKMNLRKLINLKGQNDKFIIETSIVSWHMM
jgi:hypothetical protein